MRSANRRNARLALLRLLGRALAMPARPPIAEPRRVLLSRPDHVGDVILTAPAVATLRASLPRAHITYLVGPWSEAAARGGPPVDRLRTLAFPGFTRRPKLNALQPYVTLLVAAARLRAERYDLAVVFRPDHWWGALLAAMAGIPVRVGGLTAETAPLLTHARPPAAGEHAAAEALGIARLTLAICGVPPPPPPEAPMFTVADGARAIAAQRWDAFGLGDRAAVAIQPSAGAPLKSWPVRRWAALADTLVDGGQPVLLVGAPEDSALLEAIHARMRHRVPRACGQSLEVSAALYARSVLLVSVDSGAAHLAAAVGTPTVRLYGPAPAERYGPWPPREDQRVLQTGELACVPCGHLEGPPCGARALPACMLALGVEEVAQAIFDQLSVSF